MHLPPAGTRGAKTPPIPKPMARFFTWLFRRRGAKMRIAGLPLLLLTTVGAKTGQEREVMLGWWPDPTGPEGSIVIAGTGAGSARHPAWLLNIAANPDKVWIERERVRTHARAEQLEGEARAAAWAALAAESPYRAYLSKTDREIPLLRITPD
jgi:deazaflavin-dependent oxidoreductase (nitroreductase family)